MNRLGPARIALLMLLLFVVAGTLSAAPKKSRKQSNAQRSAQQKQQALNNAIAMTKSRLQAAQQAYNALAAQTLKREAQAGGSTGRFESAKTELEARKHEADGAHLELKELQYRIEQSQSPNSPFAKAKAEYEAAVEELADARSEIYQSLDYQADYAKADAAVNRLAKIEQVTEKYFSEDEDYLAARTRTENAKRAYEQAKLAIYKADPTWEEVVKNARESYGAQSKAENALESTAIEKGVERINARDAQQRLAAAQAMLADAQSDLKRLEAQKKNLQPSKPATSNTAKKKKK